MVNCFLLNGGMRYGPSQPKVPAGAAGWNGWRRASSARRRHDDSGGLSLDTESSRAPEDAGPTLRDQSEDRRQVEEPSVDRHRRPAADAAAARRLPLCAAGDHPAPDPFIPASLFATAREQPPPGGRRGQAREAKVQELSDRLFS